MNSRYPSPTRFEGPYGHEVNGSRPEELLDTLSRGGCRGPWLATLSRLQNKPSDWKLSRPKLPQVLRSSGTPEYLRHNTLTSPTPPFHRGIVTLDRACRFRRLRSVVLVFRKSGVPGYRGCVCVSRERLLIPPVLRKSPFVAGVAVSLPVIRPRLHRPVCSSGVPERRCSGALVFRSSGIPKITA